MVILEKFGTIYLDGIPVPPGTVLTKCDSNNPPKNRAGRYSAWHGNWLGIRGRPTHCG